MFAMPKLIAATFVYKMIVCFSLFSYFSVIVVTEAMKTQRKGQIPSVEDTPVFKHNSLDASTRLLGLKQHIDIFRSTTIKGVGTTATTTANQYRKKSFPQHLSILSNSSISTNYSIPTNSTVSTNTLGSFRVYVASEATDGPSDPTNCALGDVVALPSCNLRSAWSLCDTTMADAITTCDQANMQTVQTASCTVVLPANSINSLSSLYGTTLSQLYTLPTMACQAVFYIVGNSTSTQSGGIDSSSYPVIQSDGNLTNSFLSLTNSPYLSVGLNSLNIEGFTDGALSFASISSVIIEDCHFSNNLRKGSTAIFGGAVLCDTCMQVNITRSTFTNNRLLSAIGGGGGALAFLSSTNISISYSIFEGNFAPQGGALISYDCVGLNVYNSTFHNNYADTDGAAIYFTQSNTNPLIAEFNLIQIEKSFFNQNVVRRDGGSIYLFLLGMNGNVLVELSEFNDNIAHIRGGAMLIYTDSDASVIPILIENCRFFNNSAVSDFGGAVYAHRDKNPQVLSSHTTIRTSTFLNNSALANGGGAIYFEQINSAWIFSSILQGNKAYFGGALMSSSCGLVEISLSTFDSNFATYGGAVGNNQIQSSMIVDCQFMNNSASYGGAINEIGAGDWRSLYYDNSMFYTNKAVFSGGAVAISTFINVQIDLCIFQYNYAPDGAGGAVYAQYVSSNLRITNTIFESCTAYKGGAAYFQNNQNVSFDACLLDGNMAENSGGALYFDRFNSYVSFYDSEFSHNIATKGSGGAIYFAKSNKYISVGGYLPTVHTIVNPDFVAFRDVQSVKKGTLTLPLSGDRFFVSVEPSTILDSKLGYLGTNFMPLEVTIQNMSATMDESTDVPFITTNFSDVYNAGAYLKHVLHSLPGYGTNIPMLFHGSTLVVNYTDSSSSIVLQVYSFGNNSVIFRENSARMLGGAIHWQKSNQYINVMPNAKFENNWVWKTGGSDDDSFIASISQGNSKISDDDAHGFLNQTILVTDDLIRTNPNVTKDTWDQFGNYDEGVGGALSFFQSNTNINIMYSYFRRNMAGYGGAVAFIESNSNVNIFSSDFAYNEGAGKDGGALYLGSSNTNIGIISSVFSNNNAVRNGGSCYFDSSNMVNITGCIFVSNSAGDSGGGVNAYYKNTVMVRSSSFVGNRCARDGGGICLGNNNYLTMVGGTNISDGKLTVLDGNVAVMEGGALYADSTNSLEFRYLNIVSNNTASSGGGLVFGSTTTLNMGESAALYFLDNNATVASAMWLGPSCKQSVTGYNTSFIFSNNVCNALSSTMYWSYDTTSEASFYGYGNTVFGSGTAVTWEGQSGTHISTQPVTLTRSLATYTVVDYITEQLPPIHLKLEDYYGNHFPWDSSTTVSVQILNSSCSAVVNHTLGTGVAGLGGVQLRRVTDGSVTFNNLTVSCYPGGQLTLQFIASLSDYQLSSDYNINSTSVIHFRTCIKGETIVDGKCCYNCLPLINSNTNANAVSSTSILNMPEFLAPVAVSAALFVALMAYLLWRSLRSYFALLKLPTHRELRKRRFDDSVVLASVEAFPLLTLERDIDGKSALEIAVDANASDAVILSLATIAIPIDLETKVEHPGDQHKHAWTKLIQSDQYVHVLDSIVSKNHDIAELLCQIQDDKGRTAVDIATPLCAKCLKENTYFLKRFVLLNSSYPEHESDTCILHIAFDHQSGEKKKVALKFMSSEEMYRQELASRRKYNVDPEFVINIIDTVDSTLPENSFMLDQFSRFGFAKYPYVIVMPAADRSLFYILSSENVASKNWPVIKNIAHDIAAALRHIHELGFIHGDLKPTNIMRMNGKILLIDLDASATVGESAGLKFSSGYVPPDLLVEQAGIVTFRPSIPAQPSFDMWSFGVVLFELFSGLKLFETTGEGNVADNDTLRLIKSFEGDLKRKKLNLIKDIVARNLVAQLLHIDTSKRISAAKVLNHSFFSKNVGAMKNGATYDVFISYRVASDSALVQMVYDQLTAAGFKVYLDKVCIRAGHFWEEEFCNGLSSSYIFLPLLSREAINHATEPRQNFPMLIDSSPCDNVLLEYMLALELQMRGLIVNIYPVMIGDMKPGNDKIYGNYFKDGCHPSFGANEVFVKSNQSALEGHLDRLGLGTPMLEDLSVSKTLKEITKHQGLFVEGSVRNCLQKLSAHVADMRKDIDKMAVSVAKEEKEKMVTKKPSITSHTASGSLKLPIHPVSSIKPTTSNTPDQVAINFTDVYESKTPVEVVQLQANPSVQQGSLSSSQSIKFSSTTDSRQLDDGTAISPKLKSKVKSGKVKTSKKDIQTDSSALMSDPYMYPDMNIPVASYGEQRDAVRPVDEFVRADSLRQYGSNSSSNRDLYLQSPERQESIRAFMSSPLGPQISSRDLNAGFDGSRTPRDVYGDPYSDQYIPSRSRPVSPYSREYYPPAPYHSRGPEGGFDGRGYSAGYDYGQPYLDARSSGRDMYGAVHSPSHSFDPRQIPPMAPPVSASYRIYEGDTQPRSPAIDRARSIREADVPTDNNNSQSAETRRQKSKPHHK